MKKTNRYLALLCALSMTSCVNAGFWDSFAQGLGGGLGAGTGYRLSHDLYGEVKKHAIEYKKELLIAGGTALVLYACYLIYKANNQPKRNGNNCCGSNAY